MTLCIECHYAECHCYTECCVSIIFLLNVIMLSVIMLNVIMLSVIMLNVIMLNVIMLNVIMLNVIMLSDVATWLKLKRLLMHQPWPFLFIEHPNALSAHFKHLKWADSRIGVWIKRDGLGWCNNNCLDSIKSLSNKLHHFMIGFSPQSGVLTNLVFTNQSNPQSLRILRCTPS
jgi:hypothetical protein